MVESNMRPNQTDLTEIFQLSSLNDRELPINSLPKSRFYSNIPQWQSLRSFDHIFIDFHRFFCQLYPLLVDCIKEMNDRTHAVPGHGSSPFGSFLNERAIDVWSIVKIYNQLFDKAVTPFIFFPPLSQTFYNEVTGLD